MKKRMFMALLIAALCACTAAMADDGLLLDGVIEPAKTLTLLAPYSGRVEDFAVRAGDEAAAGEMLFAISAQEVYADTDGVVCGLFAQAGDSAAVVEERYGALCSIERDALYVAECTTGGASGGNENKIVHPGETVYVRSESDSDRTGVGRVTRVSGKSYTVEISVQQNLRLNEAVEIFRNPEYSGSRCIGSGRTSRIDPVPVTAQGYVLGVHVTEGQRVRRGDLLFTMVPDQLAGMKGIEGGVCLPEDGVVLSVLCESGAQVSKDQPMATWCPAGSMEMVLTADVDDLSAIREGMQVMVTPDSLEDVTIAGTVSRVGRAPGEDGGYTVVVTLMDTRDVCIGMEAEAAF